MQQMLCLLQNFVNEVPENVIKKHKVCELLDDFVRSTSDVDMTFIDVYKAATDPKICAVFTTTPIPEDFFCDMCVVFNHFLGYHTCFLIMCLFNCSVYVAYEAHRQTKINTVI